MTFERLKIDSQTAARFQRLTRLEQVQRLDPIDFERLIGYLYQKEGHKVYLTAASGDEGIDLLLRKGSQKTVVQCKRYTGTVGQATVRDLYGAMGHTHADAGALITTGTISAPAAAWAQGKPISLRDGASLMRWIERVNRRKTPWRPSWPALPSFKRPSFSFSRPVLMLIRVLLLFSFLSVVIAGATYTARTSPFPFLANLFSRDGAAVEATVTPVATGTPATAPPATAPVYTAEPPVVFESDNGQSARVQAVRRPQGIAVDGVLEEWDDVPTVRTPYITEQEPSWNGSLDVESGWHLAWDENYLYLGVAVRDDVHVQIREPKLAYQGDSLELQLDTELDADYGPGVNDDDYQFVISPGNFEDLGPGAFRFRGSEDGVMADAPGSRVQVAARPTDTGYTLEAAIPWSDVNVNPRSGERLGIALSTNDNDSPGTAQQELLLSHVASRRWLDPTSWGIVELQ